MKPLLVIGGLVALFVPLPTFKRLLNAGTAADIPHADQTYPKHFGEGATYVCPLQSVEQKNWDSINNRWLPSTYTSSTGLCRDRSLVGMLLNPFPGGL